MSAILPLAGTTFEQPQPGFMNQCSRLQGLAGGFPGHPSGGQVAQLLIDQGDRFLRNRFAQFNGMKHLGDVAFDHAAWHKGFLRW